MQTDAPNRRAVLTAASLLAAPSAVLAAEPAVASAFQPPVAAPEGPHAWLNRAVLVGTLHPLPPEKKAVVIRVYEVV